MFLPLQLLLLLAAIVDASFLRFNAGRTAQHRLQTQAFVEGINDWHDTNYCRGNRFKWRIGIQKKCRNMFGDDSKWTYSVYNKEKASSSRCKKAYRGCSPYHYTQCCTQPEGPKTLDVYCDQQSDDTTDVHLKGKDSACEADVALKGTRAAINAMVQIADILANPVTDKQREEFTTQTIHPELMKLEVDSEDAVIKDSEGEDDATEVGQSESKSDEAGGKSDETVSRSKNEDAEKPTDPATSKGGKEAESKPKDSSTSHAEGANKSDKKPVSQKLKSNAPAPAPAAASISGPAAANALSPSTAVAEAPAPGKQPKPPTTESIVKPLSPQLQEVGVRRQQCKEFRSHIQASLTQLEFLKDLRGKQNDYQDPELIVEINKVIDVGDRLSALKAAFCTFEGTDGLVMHDSEDEVVGDDVSIDELEQHSDANDTGKDERVFVEASKPFEPQEFDPSKAESPSTETHGEQEGDEGDSLSTASHGNSDADKEKSSADLSKRSDGSEHRDAKEQVNGDGKEHGKEHVNGDGKEHGKEQLNEDGKEHGKDHVKIAKDQRDGSHHRDNRRSSAGHKRSRDLDVRVVSVNRSQVAELVVWAGYMENAVEGMETNVHPHGLKWWRYRYQYTVVESVFLVPCLLLIYTIQRFLLRLGRDVGAIRKEHDLTRTADELRQYAYVFFIIHASTLILILMLLWSIKQVKVDGKTLYDYWAVLVRDVMSWMYPLGGFRVPYEGLSYYEQMVTITFHLFGGFILYTLFVTRIIHHYIDFHKRCVAFENHDSQPGESIHTHASTGLLLEDDFEVDQFEQAFVNGVNRAVLSAKDTSDDVLQEVGAIMGTLGCPVATEEGESGEDNERPLFPFDRYILVALGASTQELVLPKWQTFVMLAVAALLICIFAVTFHFPFFAFLPVILCGCVVTFGLLFFLARQLKKEVFLQAEEPAGDEHDEDKPHSQWWTYTSVSIAVQVALFALCYSVARLLLSPDIWIFYTWAAILSLGLFVMICCAVWFVVAPVMKDMVVALSMPPNLAKQGVRDLLHCTAMQVTHFVQYEGTLALGNDIDVSASVMTVEEAKRLAVQLPGCVAFHFLGRADTMATANVTFKRSATSVETPRSNLKTIGWTTFKLKQPYQEDIRRRTTAVVDGQRKTQLVSPAKHSFHLP